MAGISKNQRPTSRGSQEKAALELKDPYKVVNKADVRQSKYLGDRGIEKADAERLTGIVPPFGSAREQLEFVAIPLATFEQYKDEPTPVPYSRVLADAETETEQVAVAA